MIPEQVLQLIGIQVPGFYIGPQSAVLFIIVFIGYQAFFYQVLAHAGLGIGGQYLAIDAVGFDGFHKLVVFDDGFFVIFRKSEYQPADNHEAIFVADLHGFAGGVHDVAFAG